MYPPSNTTLTQVLRFLINTLSHLWYFGRPLDFIWCCFSRMNWFVTVKISRPKLHLAGDWLWRTWSDLKIQAANLSDNQINHVMCQSHFLPQVLTLQTINLLRHSPRKFARDKHVWWYSDEGLWAMQPVARFDFAICNIWRWQRRPPRDMNCIFHCSHHSQY